MGGADETIFPPGHTNKRVYNVGRWALGSGWYIQVCSRKQTLLYQNLFEELNILGPYQLHSILMDYEIDYCLRSRMWSSPNLETIKAYTSCRSSRVCCVLWIDMYWNIQNQPPIISRYVEPAWCRPALTNPLCQHRWGWHHGFCSLMSCSKPTVWEVLRLPQGLTVVNRCLAHTVTPLWTSKTSSHQMVKYDKNL